VDLRSGATIGFEAVPVWDSGAEEMRADRILPLAEETGLIHQLAAGILRKACAAARAWPPGVTLSVDLLPGQLSDPTLAETILTICREQGFDHRRLEVEVAESTVVRDLEAARLALTPLRNAGVRVALDHFGTGYSNLYHLQELRLDRVKIDRRFVAEFGEAEASRIVRALAGLGQGLGISVTADGVGDRPDPSLVRAGVDVGQSSDELITGDDTLRFFASPPPLQV
jgi:EAL domain-containing protein (putative c-di-GMP-specific phosphodiesterase class I)